MTSSEERRHEVEALRAEEYPTRRATVPAMEELLYKPLPALDHGFVRVVDYMGDDAGIVQAARVSYGRGTKGVSDDRGLIRYLMRQRHSSPFEMCEIKLHVKLPIFVARQWIRHRTANVNEYSARYSVMDREFYVPDEAYLEACQVGRRIEEKEKRGQADLFGAPESAVEATAAQSRQNKQGRDEVLPGEEAAEALRLISRTGNQAYGAYAKLLNEDAAGKTADPARRGIARELARMVLPLSTYTQWYWKTDLHNLLHFIALRADPHAQYEIRVYAERLSEVVRAWVPLTHEAFLDYRVHAAQLSREGLNVVKRMVAGEPVEREDTGLAPREWRELMALLGREA